MSAHQPLRRLLGNSFWILLGEAINYPGGFLVTILVARSVSPADFGVFATVLALSMIAEQAIAIRWGDATIRFIGRLANWHEPAAALVQRQFAWGIGAAAAFGAAGLMLVNRGQPTLGLGLLVMTVHLPAAAVQNGLAGVLVAREMNRTRSVAVTMRWAVRIACTVGFLSQGWSVVGALFACAAGAWTEAAVSWTLSRLPLLRWQQATFEKRVIATAFASAVALRVFLRLDLLLLQALGGDPAMVGIYGAAKNVAQPAWTALTSLGKSTLFHVTTEADGTQGQELARRLVPWAIAPVLAWPVLAIWGEEICGLLFGPAFRVAGELLPWLYLGATAAGWVAVIAGLLLAEARHAALLATTLPLPLIGLVVFGGLVTASSPIAVAVAFAILSAGAAVGSLLVFNSRSAPSAVGATAGLGR